MQLNAVLLFVLAATFLTTGIINYLGQIGDMESVKIWLSLIIISIMALTMSIGIMTSSNIINTLRTKKILNFISFVIFLLGIIMFFMSLTYLLILLF